MFGDAPTDGVQRIGFLLLERFSLLAFSSALEPLRMANTQAGRTIYEWSLFSETGRPVAASNDMESVVDGAIGDAPPLPMLAVCASYTPERVTTDRVLSALRRLARRGTNIGAIDTGSHVVASAGLLDGYRATIHWEHLDTFAEQFPEVEALQDIFVVDRDRFSSAGGTTSLDMMLHLIRTQHGDELAVRVADEFIYHGVRDSNAPQRLTAPARLAARSPRLGEAVAFMEATVEEPLSVPDVAARVGLSTRGLERLFRRWLNTTPARYHRRLRLERARALIQQTSLPLIEVAFRCGFNSAAHFSDAYARFFGHPPSAERGRGRTTTAAA